MSAEFVACHVVDVDGSLVRVQGNVGEWDDRDKAAFVEVVRAAQRRFTAEQAAAERQGPCEGFAWIGQPFSSCNACGAPFWEHTHEMRPNPDGPFLAMHAVPISDDQREACRRKWEPRFRSADQTGDDRG